MIYQNPQHVNVEGFFDVISTCSYFTTGTSIFNYKETFLASVDLQCSKRTFKKNKK